jgi:molybdopterin/thiamine biosynthesis adenylyltransferase
MSGRSRFREIAGRPSLGPKAPASARLPELIGLDGPAATRLGQCGLAIIAAGSVGDRIAEHAARLGFGRLRIADPARLKAESVLTHAVHPREFGQYKALRTANRCKAISPTTRVFARIGGIEDLDYVALADADVVALASDNLTAEVETGQRCLHLGQTLFHAAVHGDSLVAQVRVFTNRDGRGPCPACGFGAAEWQQLSHETIHSCSGPAEGSRGTRRVNAAPTMSISALCSIAADLAIIQILRHVLGLGTPIEDEIIQYCGYTHATTRTPLRRSATCPCEHQRWAMAPAPRPIADCSAGELARMAGLDREFSLSLGGHSYVESAACCGTNWPVGRFVREGSPARRCGGCGRPLHSQPYFSRRRVPADLLGEAVDRPFRRLGGASARWVVLHGPESSTLIREEVKHGH